MERECVSVVECLGKRMCVCVCKREREERERVLGLQLIDVLMHLESN